ncbi:MAG: hypothetical protein ABIF10_00540 [Candidatus Woesearchaeota archaeon]
MSSGSIYSLGRAFRIPVNIEKIDKKLEFVFFPYNSAEIISTCIISFFGILFAGLFLYIVTGLPVLKYSAIFFSFLFAVILYIYPVNVFYTHSIMEYKEEMLRAIMRISTFVLMKTNLEYAIEETSIHLSGILKKQFQDIINRLKRKTNTTLGETFEYYTPIWNRVNPVFVKSLRMLETAAISPEEDTKRIINETIEDILLQYNTLQKRASEELAESAKKLIGFGVLFPVMLLMLLPIISVFLPELITISILVFIFNILIPTIMMVSALNFSTKRVQIDTIHIRDSPEYDPMGPTTLIVSFGVAVLFSIPTMLYLSGVDYKNPTIDMYNLYSIFMTWLLPFGIVVGVYIYTSLYKRKYGKLWDRINQTEQDLPHLLQVFSTYLTLNTPVENIFSEIVDDYKTYGFKGHPVVQIFSQLHHILLTSKKTVERVAKEDLPRICPSVKVTQLLSQIISFSTLSLREAGRATRVMRDQMVSLYKLNDYIQTLLADTVGLINVTITMLAPLLCAVAVIMSTAIVFFVQFLTEQLKIISSLGGGEGFEMQLIKIKDIIPPNLIALVVGFYLIEIILVLAIFQSNIKIGFDRYQIMKKINSSITGFATFSLILFLGYWVFKTVFFENILGGIT